MILAILLGGLVLLCLLRALIVCALYAMPLGVGAVVAAFAFSCGAGWLGSFLLGSAAAVVTVIAVRVLICARSRVIRTVTMLLVSAPAGWAGYHAMLGLTALGALSPTSRAVVSGLGAALIALIAARRTAGQTSFKRGQHLVGD